MFGINCVQLPIVRGRAECSVRTCLKDDWEASFAASMFYDALSDHVFFLLLFRVVLIGNEHGRGALILVSG